MTKKDKITEEAFEIFNEAMSVKGKPFKTRKELEKHVADAYRSSVRDAAKTTYRKGGRVGYSKGSKRPKGGWTD